MTLNNIVDDIITINKIIDVLTTKGFYIPDPFVFFWFCHDDFIKEKMIQMSTICGFIDYINKEIIFMPHINIDDSKNYNCVIHDYDSIIEIPFNDNDIYDKIQLYHNNMSFTRKSTLQEIRMKNMEKDFV